MSRAALRPAARRAWILSFLAEIPQWSVNVLDKDFVDAYIAATGAAHEPMPYGAPRCPQLGRDLSALHREGRVERNRVGISGAEWGFPKWVWDYDLPSNENRER